MGEHFRNLSCFGCDGGSSCSGFCLPPHCLETFLNPFLREFLIRGVCFSWQHSSDAAVCRTVLTSLKKLVLYPTPLG